MRLYFKARSEAEPGRSWREAFDATWPAYRRFFLKEGDAARPGYGACRRALAEHLPELVPPWERLVDLAGGGDAAARFLSMWCPPPYLSACSQVAWTRGEPALARNYDYAPELFEHRQWETALRGRRVVAMTDCLWGVLDGMNEAGLAVSLSFGGRKETGAGFGAPLLLRYVLETCDTVADARAVLARVPTHMAYNVTAIDAAGDFATALLSPDRPAELLAQAVATNHQGAADWTRYAQATASIERERLLAAEVARDGVTLDGVVARLLEPPIRTIGVERSYGTLYTAVYRPRAGAVALLWPGVTVEQRLGAFEDRDWAVDVS